MPGLIISEKTLIVEEISEGDSTATGPKSVASLPGGISLLTAQDLEDALRVWIDLNHNGIRDEGEIFEIPAPH